MLPVARTSPHRTARRQTQDSWRAADKTRDRTGWWSSDANPGTRSLLLLTGAGASDVTAAAAACTARELPVPRGRAPAAAPVRPPPLALAGWRSRPGKPLPRVLAA